MQKNISPTEEMIEVITCPICYLVMSAPVRTPMLLVDCGHSICSECLKHLKKCPICSKKILQYVPNINLSQIVDIMFRSKQIPEDINPLPPPELAKKPESIVNLFCTFAASEKTYIEQPWYHCETCGLTNSLGCCEICAKTCHKGHKVISMGISERCYCDCGSAGSRKCKCLPIKEEVCTDDLFVGQEIKQPWYECNQCFIGDPAGICQSCAIKCHHKHSLRYLGIKSSVRCVCAEESGFDCKCSHKQDVCSFALYGKKYIRQPFYNCLTCGLVDGYGCCKVCAQKCHEGHSLVLKGQRVSSYCDCGGGHLSTPCKCCSVGVIHHFNTCTNQDQQNTPKLQRMYQCHTCGMTGIYGCCEACAINCHLYHNVEYTGEKPFYCVCSNQSTCCCHGITPLRDQGTCTIKQNIDTKTAQPLYVCLSCDNPLNPQPICETCSIKCHLSHNCHFIKYGGFQCSCGLKKLQTQCQANPS